MYGGKTVEVLNTDAEGRLVLADALARACEDDPRRRSSTSPTLTGAQLVALGARTAGVMGNDDAARAGWSHAARAGRRDSVADAAPRGAARVDLDSPVADIANIGERNGGMMTAGVFLREFVAEGVPGRTSTSPARRSTRARLRLHAQGRHRRSPLRTLVRSPTLDGRSPAPGADRFREPARD